MNRASALVGSALFFVMAPGSVAGLGPWLITRWRIEPGHSSLAMFAGALTIAVSGAALVECFLRFALTAQGTPSPIAPTGRLVVTGLYRFVRNPMYVAVLGLIFGQMLLFGAVALLGYGVAIWAAFHLFVVNFEEPRLRLDFPEDYARYFQAVPRWIPRLTPWRSETS